MAIIVSSKSSTMVCPSFALQNPEYYKDFDQLEKIAEQGKYQELRIMLERIAPTEQHKCEVSDLGFYFHIEEIPETDHDLYQYWQAKSFAWAIFHKDLALVEKRLLQNPSLADSYLATAVEVGDWNVL